MTAFLCVAVATGLLATWVTAPGHRPPVPATGPRRARRHASSPLDVARMVESLATVIGSGTAPRTAWAAVSRTLPVGPLHDLAQTIAAGAHPARAITGPVSRIGGVRSLAAALAVCERSGAPAADVLHTLADALRDLHDAALARRSAFAGPRSTARILLVLPLAGVGLGMLLGADPLRLLTSSMTGHLLAITGGALTLVGWWWMHRLLRRADPPDRSGIDASVLLELIAGALRAGLPAAHAVRSVGDVLDHADGEHLRAYAAALTAGVPPQTAGTRLPDHLAPLTTAMVLSSEAGSDLSRVLRSAAVDSRRGRARDAEARAARLAVQLVLPTGLTLLPAFIALGIVPTVISLLGGSLSTSFPGAS